MKYWRGYLIAAILAVINWALVQFARTHAILMDMVYPYISRLVTTTLADWTGKIGFNLWQLLLFFLIAGVIGAVVWVILRKRNPIRLIGGILAVVSCISLLNTVIYGLNRYASPLADDIRLDITDYTVTELNQTTVYFRDKANELAQTMPRDQKGNPDNGSFEELAEQAGEGFVNLTYKEAISVFSGSTAPVKKQGWFRSKGNSGITIALTGEAAVNPKVPSACLPFAMSKEMAHRMCIYSETDANFAAFLACIHNASPAFQYSAYLMAYYYCYEALASVPTSTAQACIQEALKGESQQLKRDLKACLDFYGKTKVETTVRAEDKEITTQEGSIVTFSSYRSTVDILASWYIQKFIMPIYDAEKEVFDPKDPNQVDLTGLVNAPGQG